MRQRAVVSVLVLLGACSGPVDPPGPVPRPDRGALCDGIDNAYACSQAVERHQLSRADDWVTRAGDTLIIALDDGGTVPLVDRGAGPEVVRFAYSGYLDRIAHHLVDMHLYEGAMHVLVHDRTGAQTRVSVPPVIAPEGDRLVIASDEGEAGYRPNELQVWRVVRDGLELEWEADPTDWGASDARWTDDVTVRFDRLSRCRRGAPCRDEAVLRLGDGGWAVADTASCCPADGGRR